MLEKINNKLRDVQKQNPRQMRAEERIFKQKSYVGLEHRK